MNKNISRFLLSAVFLMCCMVANAVGTQPSNGDGSTGDPYQIATKEHLLWFADYVNSGNTTACAILTADITVNSNVLNSDGSLNSGTFETWTPIGTSEKSYAGTFDGNDHTISGLYVNAPQQDQAALFGKIGNTAYIHNLGVKDSYFRGNIWVAGICADFASGKIENCWNGATVVGCHVSTCAGGIAGSCWKNASVSGCYNIGKISVESGCSDNQCGGICGIVAKNTAVTYSVSNCVSLEGKCVKAYNRYTQNSDYTGIPNESFETIGNANIDNVTIQDAAAFTSGAVCWMLNGNEIATTWRQQIGTDGYPVLTGNYLVNYYSGSPSYCYNETICEKSSSHIHNFEKKVATRCDNSEFSYWHCTHCGKNYSYEGDGGHKNQTKELSETEISSHTLECVSGVLPTPTTTGRYGYWHCTRCGKDFLDESCTTPATEENLTVPVAKNNEIWYTQTNGKKMTLFYPDVFGATYNDAGSKYEKGLGVMIFDGDVTSFGKQSFAGNSFLLSIIIPNSITSIGAGAFTGCDSLTDIKIPDSVTEIVSNAFGGCTSLPIVNDIRYADRFLIEAIDKTLSAYTIKEGTKWIDDRAFEKCSSLTGITLPKSMTNIGANAFSKCTNLSTITLQDGVVNIGTYAFNECSGLQSITIPGSVKNMGESVFNNCSSLNNVTIGDGAYIGASVFMNYTGSLTINGSLSGVGNYAFNGCPSLESVSFESGSIGSYAFKGCTNLSTVTLMEGVTAIGDHAFSGCNKLTSMSIDSYIGDSAFNECTGLESVTVKNGNIGMYAFKNCINLRTITLMEGVTGIGSYAFEGCSMQSMTIPGSVKSMGSNVFNKCSTLNDVTIGDGAYIGASVFMNYTGTLTINGSLSGVGDYAFKGCTSLTSVTIESGSLKNSAFEDCTNLKTVSLLGGVTDIGQTVFKGCGSLKDIFVKWTKAEKIPSVTWGVFDGVDRAKAILHIPSYTTDIYKAKDVWNSFNIVEDINFIITKTDDTKVEKKLQSGDEVTIDESEDDIMSLVVSEKVSNVGVTYIRNFANADKWQGWYVPFDVPVADMDAAGFEVAKIYGILLDNSGNTVLAFLKIETGTVKANTLYVVRPKESGKVTVNASETTIYPTSATSMYMMSITDTYTVGGIYEKTTTPGNWYAINKDGRFQKMGTGVGLRPFRIWMTIDPREDNPYAEPEVTKSGMNMMVISKGQLYEGDL